MAKQNTNSIRISQKLHDQIMAIKFRCKAKNVDEILTQAIKLLKEHMKNVGY
jgi:hypothetical protein